MAHLVRVLVGSLRQASYNRALARFLMARAPVSLRIEECPIGDLPLYDEDLEASPPAPVIRLREQITACDAVLFVMPEYNRSISGALKNAIDWGSRPPRANVWKDKPGAVTGVSRGAVGTAAGQQHLRLVASAVSLIMMPRPEMYLTWRDDLLDDPSFHKLADGFLGHFAEWIDKVR